MAVERIVDRYRRYLAVDPAYLGYDYDYVTVHPISTDNVVTVDYKTYDFLEAVNKLYFGNSINLNHWVRVSAKIKGKSDE